MWGRENLWQKHAELTKCLYLTVQAPSRCAAMESTPSELLHKTMQLLQHRMQIPVLIRKEAKRSKIQ